MAKQMHEDKEMVRIRDTTTSGVPKCHNQIWTDQIFPSNTPSSSNILLTSPYVGLLQSDCIVSVFVSLFLSLFVLTEISSKHTIKFHPDEMTST